MLGYAPPVKRTLQFFSGVLVFGIVSLLMIYAEGAVLLADWQWNPGANWTDVLRSLRYHFISALTEELIYRGALLYILLVWLKEKFALLISALAFGVYHWFSFGILNEGPLQLTLVLLITGSMGWAWAYSYARTGSIVLALGMHLAHNFTSSLFMDTTPFGNLLFQVERFTAPASWIGLSFTLTKALVFFGTALLLVKAWKPARENAHAQHVASI